MRRRGSRRTTRRGKPLLNRYATGFVVVLLVVSVTALPTTSFLSATLDRSSTTNVVVDGEAVAGLEIAGTVHTGETERLVTVTNNFSQDLQVTTALDSGSTDVGNLVVGGVSEGDSTTFDLGTSASQRVDLDTACDRSLDGRTVSFSVSVTGSGLDGVVERARTTVRHDTPTTNRDRVVFVGKGNKYLKTIDRSGTITTYSQVSDPHGIGPYSTDIDGDGTIEIPYVSSGDELKMTDANGETQTLVSGTHVDGPMVAVGDVDCNGTPSVFWTNHDDGHNLYRVEYGGSPTKVGSGFKSYSVAGVTDFDGDGNTDIVVDDGNNVKYIENTTTGWTVHDTGVDTTDKGAIGLPKDFDGDGEVRVPIYNGSMFVTLLDSQGNTRGIGSYNTPDEKALIGSFDWNGDGTPDLLTRNKADNGYLYYLQLDGTNQRITDSSGNPVAAEHQGVA